jgi:hypothetical protein
LSGTRYRKGGPDMIVWIIFILLVLWFLGLIGRIGGNLIHLLLAIVVVLFLVRLAKNNNRLP